MSAVSTRKSSRQSHVELRRRPRQERSQMTVEAILEATYELFHAKAFETTSIRIAQRAGVSVGSLYQYFPNKESVLQSLVDQKVTSAFGDVITRLIGDLRAHGDTERFVTELVDATMALYRQEALLLDLQRRFLMGNQPSMVDCNVLRTQVDDLKHALAILPGSSAPAAALVAPLVVQTVDSLCRHFVLQADPQADAGPFRSKLVDLLSGYLK